MQVLCGNDVDVLEPFPSGYLGFAESWVHAHKTLVFGDQPPEDIPAFLAQRMALPGVRSWAIVDKHNLTGARETKIPLIGMLFFEQNCPENGYAHVATSRRAWGEKIARPALVDQACALILDEVWASTPTLNRVSIATYATNKAAKHLAYRMGFTRDGYFKNMGTLKGAPVDIIHFGLLRPGPQAPKEALDELGSHTEDTATAN